MCGSVVTTVLADGLLAVGDGRRIPVIIGDPGTGVAVNGLPGVGSTVIDEPRNGATGQYVGPNISRSVVSTRPSIRRFTRSKRSSERRVESTRRLIARNAKRRRKSAVTGERFARERVSNDGQLPPVVGCGVLSENVRTRWRRYPRDPSSIQVDDRECLNGADTPLYRVCLVIFWKAIQCHGTRGFHRCEAGPLAVPGRHLDPRVLHMVSAHIKPAKQQG